MTDVNSVWNELRNRVANCKRCWLHENRCKAVFGTGPLDSRIVLIGEAPGAEEDKQGEPFVGESGQLLTGILENGGGIKRSGIFITNVVKCRPPNNQDPASECLSACREYLEAQLLLLRPKIVITAGRISTSALLGTGIRITEMHGKWLNWRGIKLFPMFHPSYIIRQRDEAERVRLKMLTWDDVKKLRLGIEKLDINKESILRVNEQENPDAPGNNS